MAEVKKYIDRIPLFSGAEEAGLDVERLGGLTNVVYRIKFSGNNYLLRIPGKGTEEYIDRQIEEHDARVAADSGVSPNILFFDSTDGLMLAEYIDGKTMNAKRFKNLGCVDRAAKAFRMIHDCPNLFKKRFDVFEQIDDYLQLVKKLNAEVPEGYEAVNKQADAIRSVLEAKPAKLVPCHCDPLAENFIDTGDRTYIVDWEYGGNNDPMWDLGDLSVEAEFDQEQERVLLESYFDGNPPEDQVGRMVIYKSLCDLLWTLWGVVQHANKNPVDDFWAYSVNRFDRCKALMDQPDFKSYLSAI